MKSALTKKTGRSSGLRRLNLHTLSNARTGQLNSGFALYPGQEPFCPLLLLAFLLHPTRSHLTVSFAGYYCPMMSSIATPCPAGTQNPDEGKGSVIDCRPCEVDHFNNLLGQKYCFSCGGESFQRNTVTTVLSSVEYYFPSIQLSLCEVRTNLANFLQGSVTCECLGNGRDFQHSDKTCPCAAGFRESNRDDDDCTRRVYPLCTGVESRSQQGECYSPSQWEDYCRTEVQ